MILTDQQDRALRAEVVVKATSKLGVREVGFTNSGPEVDEFLAYVGDKPGSPWCCAFACWTVGRSAAAVGLTFEDTNLTRTGYCPDEAAHARSVGALLDGRLVAPGDVRPGDVMLMWEADLRGYHHAGIVTVAPDASGAFRTVEGNSDTNGSREGYEVASQSRDAHDVATDGHNKYAFVRLVG